MAGADYTGWTSVKDALPKLQENEPRQVYFIVQASITVIDGFFLSGAFHTPYGTNYEKVTHWQYKVKPIHPLLANKRKDKRVNT